LTLPPEDPLRITAARAGDGDAWTGLVRAWGPAVLSWCRYQGGGAPDPEDAAHEVFIRLFRRIHRLRDPSRFRSFLYGITRRVISEHRRRAWWRRWAPGEAAAPARDGGHDPEARCALNEAARGIEEALARVPARFREVLVHCDVEGRAPAEVAALLGVSANTVRSRLARGRARFRLEAARRGVSVEGALVEGAHV